MYGYALRYERSAACMIPIYRCNVQAGFPSPPDDYVDGKLDLNKYLISNPPATFFVRAIGDSMKGAGIYSGDILVVDRSLEAKDGKIVIAAIDGNLTVKRLIKRNGKLTLKSENSSFCDIEIEEGNDLVIWGVVTSVLHKV